MYIWHFICVCIYNKSDYIMQPAIIQYWKVGKGGIYICWIRYITKSPAIIVCHQQLYIISQYIIEVLYDINYR
jgi:hypothetical protein